VVKKLETQVKYYSREILRFKSPGLPSFPSIPWNEFEKLTLAAKDVAIDYPVVQSALFFYEIQSGRPSEAKKYARYISDDVYMQAVYGMNWVTGLRMR
jgi:hypothetical protein